MTITDNEMTRRPTRYAVRVYVPGVHGAEESGLWTIVSDPEPVDAPTKRDAQALARAERAKGNRPVIVERKGIQWVEDRDNPLGIDDGWWEFEEEWI